MLVVNPQLTKNSLRLLHIQILNHLSLCSLSLIIILFTQTTDHSTHFCFGQKITCRYKQANVQKDIKIIAIQLFMDSIPIILELATSTCTLAPREIR
jgi:hypothetical protein